MQYDYFAFLGMDGKPTGLGRVSVDGLLTVELHRQGRWESAPWALATLLEDPGVMRVTAEQADAWLLDASGDIKPNGEMRI